MRIGLQIPSFTWEGGAAEAASKLKTIAQTAEAGGFYSLWVMDHFFQIRGVGSSDEDMYEGYTTLGYLAALTSKVKLGTMVTGAIYRYPGVLVKTVTSLDVLSGGRAYFGVGAGWNEEESLGLGVPFPPVAERFERLEETLQIAHQMWKDDQTPYKGKHNQLDRPMGHPLPLSKPHPPILIGGMGENKTMRLIAKYGDACNFFMRAGTEAMQTRLDTIKRNCDEMGRDYAEIEKTALGTFDPSSQSAADVLGQLKQIAAMGFTHAIFNMPGVETLKPVETFIKDIIPAAAAF